MPDSNKGALWRKAKRYSSIKYLFAILDTAYLLALLLIFTASGSSKALAQRFIVLAPGSYFYIPLYLLAISMAYYALNFPLNFYSSYILEHKFALSGQKIGDWAKDQLKGGVIYYIISLILLFIFYYIAGTFLRDWWWILSICWIFFSLILAKLTPVIIIPLFFKYKRLSNDALRGRIMNLADKMGVKLLDVFEIDFSRKTMKANAAFVGMGKTRRVILADTLKDKYSDDEIEVILAHEFAHYKLKHLLKLILVNSASTVAVFYLIYRTSGYLLEVFGLSSLMDIAALPVVIIYMVLFGMITQPFGNYISRCFEMDADRMALLVTGKREAFISTMNKLADQNLSDRNPHPLIKFFFFDHPPIDERINLP
ncbi:MAG: M48 family metallopeptidase [Candidatus Omnitrophota bacterium]|jgi:STE24 endopeptidase